MLPINKHHNLVTVQQLPVYQYSLDTILFLSTPLDYCNGKSNKSKFLVGEYESRLHLFTMSLVISPIDVAPIGYTSRTYLEKASVISARLSLYRT
jgi:hypothetical protein